MLLPIRAILMLVFLPLAFVGLSGCTRPVVVEERVTTVKVPVPAPCATERPAPVAALNKRIPRADWRSMDVVQKSATVGKQGLDRQTYGEKLNAATAGCPQIAQ